MAVTLLLAQPQDGENRLTIDRSSLNIPAQITLDGVDPEVVGVRAWPLTPTLIQVHVLSRGRLPDSLELVSLRAEPDSVTVLTREGSAPAELVTEPVPLDSVGQTGSMKRALVLPEGVLLPDQKTAEVTVFITVRPKAPGGLSSRHLGRGRTGILTRISYAAPSCAGWHRL